MTDMTEPIQFILNNAAISTVASPTTVLVDFIREQRSLKGTTVACREGDCGACTTLIGELRSGELHYRSVTSCIYPLGNVAGRHVVTVEGLGNKSLNPIQEAMLEFSGTQCGFCTPGFVVSLAGLFLKHDEFEQETGISEIDGNICRCTGYKSIERAVHSLREQYQGSPKKGQTRMEALVERGILPDYFLNIGERLEGLQPPATSVPSGEKALCVGGGTDLYVQIPEKMPQKKIRLTRFDSSMRGVTINQGRCTIGASTSVEEIRTNQELNSHLPGIEQHLKLFGSTPIRQQASLGGNLVNASPIGDSTILFLALDAEVILAKGEKSRKKPLREFYLDYKKLDRYPNELVNAVEFALPAEDAHFNFEKVSRRTYLDIASVNSGFLIRLKGSQIVSASLSAGGVAAIPFFLNATSEFLCGREISARTVRDAVEVLQAEISPISDVRGSADYKRLLLRQLFFAHFIRCFPKKISLKELV